MNDIFWTILLAVAAVGGYGIRSATSFSISEWDAMLARFCEVNDRLLYSLREAAEICRQSEQQRDAYIADQRDELKRVHDELVELKRERESLHEELERTRESLRCLLNPQCAVEEAANG